MQRSFAFLDTPIGRRWIVVSPRGLVAISRADVPPADARADQAAARPVLEQLAAYFAGQLREFTIALDVADASAFDRGVWNAARTVPYASTVSYGELALMAGHPGAARAVGGSMARCPVAPVVPCHRVIHADGSIGGWGRDTWVKRWLLDLEASGIAAPNAAAPFLSWSPTSSWAPVPHRSRRRPRLPSRRSGQCRPPPGPC